MIASSMILMGYIMVGWSLMVFIVYDIVQKYDED